MGKHLLTPGHLAANATPNSVYRYFDHADRLIYIGVTARGIQRQHEHEKLSDWFDHADHQQIEKCPDRASALTLERELIKAYRPPFNKVHNGDWEPVRDAYLAVVTAERALRSAQSGEPLAQPPAMPCHHCAGCYLAEDPDLAGEDYAVCVLLTEEDDADEKCPKCGKHGCVYLAGLDDGRSEGWRSGYDQGDERGYSEAREHYRTAIVANGALSMAVDRIYPLTAREQTPLILEPQGRDASLVALESALANLRSDNAAEVAH
jgi:predicted GIY-YIG superfamily endonuclease